MTTFDKASALSVHDRELLAELRETVHALLPASTILLYGSAARGDRDAESDYDILVLTKQPLPLSDQTAVRRAVFHVELRWDAVCSLLFCSNDEWEHSPIAGSPFRQRVERDGVVL